LLDIKIEHFSVLDFFGIKIPFPVLEAVSGGSYFDFHTLFIFFDFLKADSSAFRTYPFTSFMKRTFLFFHFTFAAGTNHSAYIPDTEQHIQAQIYRICLKFVSQSLLAIMYFKILMAEL